MCRVATKRHGVVRDWIKVPTSYCFRLQLVPSLYAAKAGLRKGKGLLVEGESNPFSSWGDLNPGLAVVAVQFMRDKPTELGRPENSLCAEKPR